MKKEREMPGIVVGVDGSANARRALDWAVNEGTVRHAPVTVITVNEVAASLWTHRPVTVPADQALLNKVRESARALADKAVSELGGGRPASITIKAVNGFAAKELIDASHDADLVVIGARGGPHGDGLAHQPLGSICNKVLHHAACPVVVVPSS
jgi:nucleotide-binding universal stress UspA family protein